MNRTHTSARIAAAAALGFVALFGVPALAQDNASGNGMAGMNGNGMAGMNHSAPMEPGSASARYMDAMKTMDASMQGMTMTGKAGVDYAAMMIPHHQSAIDMAEAYLASGETDPVLTKLSQDIVASQKSEIATLKEWLAKNAAK